MLKWSEATTGPPKALTEVLEGSDEQFREKLMRAQTQCPELKPIKAALEFILNASQKESTVDAEKASKEDDHAAAFHLADAQEEEREPSLFERTLPAVLSRRRAANHGLLATAC